MVFAIAIFALYGLETNPTVTETVVNIIWGCSLLTIIIAYWTIASSGLEIDTDEKTIRRTFWGLKASAIHYEKMLPWYESILGSRSFFEIVNRQGKTQLFCVIGKGSLSDDLNSRLGVLPEDLGPEMPLTFSLPKRAN